LILTNGNRGTADHSVKPKQLAKTRQQEQREAAQLLGVRDVFFCDYDDCALECCDKVRRDIVRYIRKLRPDTVMTIDPTMVYSARWGYINHPDHRQAGQATIDAVYPLARDHLSFPELLRRDKLQTHKVDTLLLLNFENYNYSVDISDFIEQKQSAMLAHTSQISDSDTIRQTIHDQAAYFGQQAGITYAEPYMRISIQI
jgi:LmbE family N-acetylglucosaminyl deacetylase